MEPGVQSRQERVPGSALLTLPPAAAEVRVQVLSPLLRVSAPTSPLKWDDPYLTASAAGFMTCVEGTAQYAHRQ